jgi:hypothetical protein
MPRYRYRTLRCRTWDKHGQPMPKMMQKRGGDKPDRILYITDSFESQSTLVTDKRGDDFYAFRDRAYLSLVRYLDRLGPDGWQVVAGPTSITS